jgi:hypothetical protein
MRHIREAKTNARLPQPLHQHDSGLLSRRAPEHLLFAVAGSAWISQLIGYDDGGAACCVVHANFGRLC